MEEGSSGGGGGGGGESSSRVTPSYVKLGDREIFTVELRPGETTFVSWKKLMKDGNKANNSGSALVPGPPPADAHPNLESRRAPGQPAENEGKDGPNRFSAVIEKIERLYMGKDSSDEEDLKDVPDDDQYDTDDSFIDDAELDEYFEVDNSAIKHDGFFVNRGKLERITVPTVQPNQQPKKRRRKDLNKAPGEHDDGHISTKQVKTSKVAVSKAVVPLGKDISNPSQSVIMKSDNNDDVIPQNLPKAFGVPSKRKSAENKMNLDPSSLTKVPNGDTSVPSVGACDIDKPKNTTNKSKDVSGSMDVCYPKDQDKSAYPQVKVQSSKRVTNVDEVEPSVRSKEKNGVRELPDLNMPDGRVSMQVSKPSHVHKRESSSVKSKGAMLENAIRELEKMVAESRPPALDNQDADAQAIKRRLPREIKLKLAKVARLAASQGEVSEVLLNRLMSSLGHLIQLRTLKRNLKVMISMGLSAKQEKDVRFQQVKKEVSEMITTRAPSESKALEQQAGTSDDFQEKGSQKRKFSMDAVLEDKICDLYDLFVDGLDEDAGPQVRKLYIELAGLWPNGSMDNHGIKRAICRAKERRKALYNRHKEQEKMKRKKMMEETSSRVEEKLGTDTSGPVLALASKLVPISTTTSTVSPSGNAPTTSDHHRVKPKASSTNPMDMGSDGALVKKKVKRKPEIDMNQTLYVSASSEEKTKSLAHKLNLELTALSSFQQNS